MLNCGSWNLMPLGIGTDTVFEEIKSKFSLGRAQKIKIFKLDRESVKTNKEAEKNLKGVRENFGFYFSGYRNGFLLSKGKS